MYLLGDYVWLQSGGYGGLDYHFLKEERFCDYPGKIIAIEGAFYLIKSNFTSHIVKVHSSDIKGKAY